MNVAALTKYQTPPGTGVPRSWLLTFTEGSDVVNVRCYLHGDEYGDPFRTSCRQRPTARSSFRPLVTYHCDADLVETWITLGLMRDEDGRFIAHSAAARVHACNLPMERG